MLRITKQADYGIVLMTQMAAHPGRCFAASELATETQIPFPTVSKILKLLAREGLLSSRRGVKGGYCLDRDPEDISVSSMIAALDGPIAFTECIEGTPGNCIQEEFCRLRANWQRINQAVQAALEKITLADFSQSQIPQPQVQPLVQLGADEASNRSLSVRT